jgi:hypothetical protein
MATVLALIEALPQLLKLVGFIIDSVKKTPAEKRREALAQLDAAITKAYGPEPDLTDLSKWFGKRL